MTAGPPWVGFGVLLVPEWTLRDGDLDPEPPGQAVHPAAAEELVPDLEVPADPAEEPPEVLSGRSGSGSGGWTSLAHRETCLKCSAADLMPRFPSGSDPSSVVRSLGAQINKLADPKSCRRIIR